MRIALVIPSMSSGGAERVMSILANFWAARGDEVTLITLGSLDLDFYNLDSRINRVALDVLCKSSTTLDAIKNNCIRLIKLRKAVHKTRPEVIISFMDSMSVVTLLSTIGMSIPVVVSEHIDPRQKPPPGIWNFLRRWTYSLTSAVVVLTSELREVVNEFVPEKKLHVIPNPAIPVPKASDLKPPFILPSHFVIAMGRLTPQKGFDFLLDAFALCTHTSWSLVILGEGPDREGLETQIKQLNLGSRVFLPGNISEPAVILRKSGLFVLSSRFEGFPMALVEAMSCGLPVVSFDCPTGPGDIIRDGYDGVLVPPGDVGALMKEMDRMMGDKEERKKLAGCAKEVIDRFSIEKIIGKWDDLLNKVTMQKNIIK